MFEMPMGSKNLVENIPEWSNERIYIMKKSTAVTMSNVIEPNQKTKKKEVCKC